MFPLISLSKRQCWWKWLFVTVYQQVEWNSRDKSNIKQLIYENDWLNHDFEFTSEGEVPLTSVAVINP